MASARKSPGLFLTKSNKINKIETNRAPVLRNYSQFFPVVITASTGGKNRKLTALTHQLDLKSNKKISDFRCEI